jgi:hypothetical protein
MSIVTSNITGSGSVIVIDEDDMVSGSATQPPSQQSVKAYVDGLTEAASQITQHSANLAINGYTPVEVDNLTLSAGKYLLTTCYNFRFVTTPIFVAVCSSNSSTAPR